MVWAGAVMVIVLLFELFAPSQCHKILLYPLNIKSHVLVAGRFGGALVQNGHEVHLLVATNSAPPHDLDPEVKTLTYDVSRPTPFPGTDEAAAMEIRLIELADSSFMEWILEGIQIYVSGIYEVNRECEDLLGNARLTRKLANENYDLIVLDSVHIAFCPPVLAYKLGVPVAILSTTNNEWFYRIPHLSHMPSIATESTDVMTFAERVKSFIVDLVEHFALNSTTYYCEKYVPEKPVRTALDIDSEAVFIFGLYDPVLVYPRPLMPNTMNVGGLMARPGKPLDAEFSRILESAPGGVILMSLGSLFAHMPDKWVVKFCDAFNDIEDEVQVIWQSGEEPNCTLPANVVVKSWVPQNDLLAHANLKLFITHGGLNSYIEAVNHGKPMIAFPLSLDRPRYALAMETKGLGIRMNILRFTSQELAHNIKTILNNDSYMKSAQMLSAKMRDNIMPVDKRIAFWVDHVVKFGADHLRTGAYQLSLFQFLMLDVYALLFIVTLVLGSGITFLLHKCARILLHLKRRVAAKIKAE